MGGFLGAANLGTNVIPVDLVTGMDYVCALTSAGGVKWCDLKPEVNAGGPPASQPARLLIIVHA